MSTLRAPVLVVSLALAAAIAGCGPVQSSAIASSSPPSAAPTTAGGSPVPAATAAPSPGRADGWRGDLAALVPGMAGIHPNLFHGTSRAELEAAVAALSATAETATDDELMVGVVRLAALVSARGCDGHTGAFIWGTGTYPVDSLPLRLWLFDDEVVIVDALAPHEGLVGSRIDTVEGRPIADVLAALDPLIPRDNAQTVRLLSPRYLLIPQVLRGLGLADGGPVSLTLTSVDGVPATVDVEPVPMAAYNAWAGPYGLHLPADPAVRYLSRMSEDLWWERLADDETLYVQYNHVDHLAPSVLEDLGNAMRATGAAPVILDVRHNTGGEVPALDPLVALLNDPLIDTPDGLFVLTGRNTWSAGSLLLARLDATTDAVVVGESMGGCPTFYGDVVQLPLPYSGLSITVTEMLEIGVTADDERSTIEPDVPIDLTVEEWLGGRDPVLAAIEGSGP